MKKLTVTWDGIQDSTGYLHSFAKCLYATVKYSPWSVYAEDILAISGFAFRMWVDAELCPSSTSNWDWNSLKRWVEQAGFTCAYTEGGWAQENVETLNQAIEQITTSIDKGLPAIVWCITIPEWGLITGYDEVMRNFDTLAAFHGKGTLPYDQLGKGAIPILSVLTITGHTNISYADMLRVTLNSAIAHLKGEEYCDNPSGLNAYSALIQQLEPGYNPDLSWNLEYLIGTYGALKYYAWKYFDKEGLTELARLYFNIHQAWVESFKIKKLEDTNNALVRSRIVSLLRCAYKKEAMALKIMEMTMSGLLSAV